MIEAKEFKINDVISEVHSVKYGVPQGSYAGPIIFLGYLTSLYDIFERHFPHVRVGGYADDHQLYLSYTPGVKNNENEMIIKFGKCIEEVRTWMLTHRLKINDSKTECMFIGTQQQLHKVELNEINVGHSVIKPTKVVRNLGVLFDQQMTMADHVKNISRKGFAQLKRIRQIRSYLDQSSAENIVHAFVTSNIDYCNALLFGAPKHVIQNLQRLQNATARVICGLRKYDHITEALRTLHWLPVAYRIKYKIAILAYKCIYNQAPDYLNNMVEVYHPSRSLRSSNRLYLKQQHSKTKTLGPRAFSHAAPAVWNDLPDDIRLSNNFNTFKSKLKTHYFRQAF